MYLNMEEEQMVKINRRIFLIYIMVTTLLFSSCDVSEFIKNDDAKARMVVIGMDYQNNEIAPSLTGVINDVYEISAAFKEVYGKKNIDLDIHYLVQEGFDVLVEIKCYAASNDCLNVMVEEIKEYVSSLAPTPTDVTGYYDSTEGFIIRFFVNSTETAENIKQDLSNIYAETNKNVEIKYASTQKASSYPTNENIIKAIENAKTLRSNDLYIMYYTGHGEVFKTISDEKLRKILTPFLNDGSITDEVYNATLELEIKDETNIYGFLAVKHVDSSVVNSISLLVKEEIEKEPVLKGALITACTDQVYYDLFDMERLYSLLSELPCKVILIIDACYSGFASLKGYEGMSFADSLKSFMVNSPTLPNVAVISASSKDETSKVTVIKTQEDEFQRHSAFTLKVLDGFNWIHTSQRKTYLRVPYFKIGSDGSLEETTTIREIDGYVSSAPQRITINKFFDSIQSKWDGIDQHPQRNNSGYEICIIP